MKWAKAIREFFSILFGSQLVVQLRREIESLKGERDYFRGQFERMQLLAIPRSTPPQPRGDWRTTDPQGATKVGTRKTWAQIQAENTQNLNEERAAVAKENEEKPQ